MFCLWEKFSQRVCHIQIRMYFANFYVNNALHGATLANCSHFQYVSILRLWVIWISVKTCINVTLYDEPFVTYIIEKHILIPLRITLTAVQWSTPRSVLYSLAKISVGYTIDLVHSMAYFIEPIVYPALSLEKEYNSDLGVDHWTLVKIILSRIRICFSIMEVTKGSS